MTVGGDCLSLLPDQPGGKSPGPAKHGETNQPPACARVTGRHTTASNASRTGISA